jgi:hypothetical protein
MHIEFAGGTSLVVSSWIWRWLFLSTRCYHYTAITQFSGIWSRHFVFARCNGSIFMNRCSGSRWWHFLRSRCSDCITVTLSSLIKRWHFLHARCNDYIAMTLAAQKHWWNRDEKRKSTIHCSFGETFLDVCSTIVSVRSWKSALYNTLVWESDWVNEWINTLVAMVTCDITPICQVIVEVEKDYILCGVRTEAEETVIIETVRSKPQLNI